jgi:hypothetical protein
MAMKCRYCGAENPDCAAYCGRCSESLEDNPFSTVGEEPPGSMDEAEEKALSSLKKSPGTSSLSLASITLTISLFLTSLGCVLYIYYYERWLQDIHGSAQTQIALMESLRDIIKAMDYSHWLGDASLILGLVFIVQALTGEQLRVRLMTGLSDRILVWVKWLLIIAAALLAIFVLLYFAQSELNAHLDSALSIRLYYLQMIAWPFVAAASVAFAFALRKAQATSR